MTPTVHVTEECDKPCFTPCRLSDEEKSRELRQVDGDKFVAFQFREQVCAGNHSKPLTFAQLVSKWPGALIVCLLLIAIPAQGQQLVQVREPATGRMSVVQVYAPAPQPVERPRPSPFDAYWRNYSPPRSTAAVRGYVSAPPTVWNPKVIYPWKR